MNTSAQEIIENFSLFTSWEEKYEYIIDLGREMKPIKDEFKKDKYLIHGCQSKVWLYCENRDEKLYFYGDSDALITKGIVAIIIKLYSGLTKKEIKAIYKAKEIILQKKNLISRKIKSL